MSKMSRVFLMLSAGGMMFAGGCLPNNFWGDKWGEIVNTVIMDFVNTTLIDGIGGILPI